MTTAERVILINGDANKWYDQAIFIVKPGTKANAVPGNMVDEAEHIIANYLTRNKKPLPANFPAIRAYADTDAPATTRTKKRAGSSANFLLNVLMILACLALALVFIYGMVL